MAREKLYKPLSECVAFFGELLSCKSATNIEKALFDADYQTINTAILVYSIGKRYRNSQHRKVFLHPEQLLATEAVYVCLTGPEDHEGDVLYLSGKLDLIDNIKRGMRLCDAL